MRMKVKILDRVLIRNTVNCLMCLGKKEHILLYKIAHILYHNLQTLYFQANCAARCTRPVEERLQYWAQASWSLIQTVFI